MDCAAVDAATWYVTVTMADWPAGNDANEQEIDCVPEQAVPVSSSVTFVTTSNGSTVSVTTTFVAVDDRALFVTVMVNVWSPSPAVMVVSGANDFTTLRSTSPMRRATSWATQEVLPPAVDVLVPVVPAPACATSSVETARSWPLATWSS